MFFSRKLKYHIPFLIKFSIQTGKALLVNVNASSVLHEIRDTLLRLDENEYRVSSGSKPSVATQKQGSTLVQKFFQ